MFWRLRRKYRQAMPACRFHPRFHTKSRRVNPAIPSAAFLMQMKYKRLSPHVPRTSPFSSAIFHAARTLSGSLRSPPSPRGEGGPRQRWIGTFVNGALETHFPFVSAVFHTASALSAPTGHLPLEGKADDTRETCYRKPSGIAPYIFAAKPPPQP